MWYKDRLGRSRGPCELIQLKTAWGAGIIDKNTFVWGEDMDEWAPIHMVYGLEPAIATWEGLLNFNLLFLLPCFFIFTYMSCWERVLLQQKKMLINILQCLLLMKIAVGVYKSKYSRLTFCVGEI